jgi:hypothetical protein
MNRPLPWLRWYVGTLADPKLTTVARRCRQKKTAVIAVWACVLEAACAKNNGGGYSMPADEIAALLELRVEQVDSILTALEDRGLLENGLVVKWEARQYASDSSAVRMRKHRENAQKRNGDGGVTSHERTDTPSEDRVQRDSTEEGLKASAPPPAPRPRPRQQDKPGPSAEELTAVGDGLLEELPAHLRVLADEYLAEVAAHNKTNRLTAERRLSLLREIGVYLTQHGPDALVVAFETAHDAGSETLRQPPREPGPDDLLVERAWTFCGLAEKPTGKGYGLPLKMAQTYPERLEQWMKTVQPPKPPETGDPMAWFGQVLREAMTQHFTWDGSRGGAGKPSAPSGPPIPDTYGPVGKGSWAEVAKRG